MKTASLTYPSHTLRFIDTAPLAARYAVIVAAVMRLIEIRQMGQVLRLTYKVQRLVRIFAQLDTHNNHLRRKLDMLAHKPWREQVLRELGGLRKLKLWEAARARIAERQKNPPRPAPLSISEQMPAWLLTPERMAESERLKAHIRLCGRATTHPFVFRDRVKMDFDGMFRLAPLPRGERAARQVKVYTQNSIVDYDWNNIPFAKETGLGPAVVWPVEFYAAIALEQERGDGEYIKIPCIPSKDWVPNQVWDERNNKNDNPPPLIPLRGIDKNVRTEALHPKQILSPKVWHDLFGSLTR